MDYVAVLMNVRAEALENGINPYKAVSSCLDSLDTSDVAAIYREVVPYGPNPKKLCKQDLIKAVVGRICHGDCFLQEGGL